MTRKTLFRVLVAMLYLWHSGDFSGYRWLLPKKLKIRLYRPGLSLLELNRITREVIAPDLVERIFQTSPIIGALMGGRKEPCGLNYADYIMVPGAPPSEVIHLTKFELVPAIVFDGGEGIQSPLES